jgi:hypothetical protein
MWDLTIQTDHNFYISVSDTAVLVHNCPADQGANTSGEVNGGLGELVRVKALLPFP